MIKKLSVKKILFIVCVFAGLIFFLENYYIKPSRKHELLKGYVHTLQEEQARAFAQIQEQSQNGSWDKFFLVKMLTEDNLNEIKKSNRQIKDIALIDSEYHIIGQTISENYLSEIILFIKKAGSSLNRQNFLLSSGWYSIFIIKNNGDNLLGFLLIQWKLLKPPDNLGVFLTTPSAKSVYLAPVSFLNDNQKNIFMNFLESNRLYNEYFYYIKIDEKNYDLSIDYIENENFYLGFLQPSRPLFHSISFYFLAISAISLFIHFIVDSKKESSTPEVKNNYENIRKILETQKQALTSMESGLENLRKTYTGTSDMPVEKSVKAAVIEKEEKPDEDDEEIFSILDKEVSPDKTLELRKVKREFQFLDTFEKHPEATFEVSKEIESLSSEEMVTDKEQEVRQKAFTPELRELINDIREVIREAKETKENKESINIDTEIVRPEENRLKKEKSEKIFTPELRDLIKEVKKEEPILPRKSHEQNNLLENKITEIEEKINLANINEFDSKLNEIYFDDISIGELKDLISLFRKKLNASASSLLYFRQDLGCYQTVLSENLPSDFDKTFYMLENDFRIREESIEKPVFIEIDENHKNDIFFTKRFPADVLDKLKEILIIPLKEYHFDGYFYFMYDEDAENKDNIIEQAQKTIKELSPAIKYYFQKKEIHDIINQAADLTQELNLITAVGREPAKILHIYPKKAITKSEFQELKKELSKKLNGHERMILNSPSHLLFLLKENFCESIINIVSEKLEIANSKELHYPDRSSNFFNYI
ncbi:MAG: hypothetical protein OEZ13_00285 [Spirochaetia bacterium]|nr:hypothetical protein [Spirochaetia bacterium]